MQRSATLLAILVTLLSSCTSITNPGDIAADPGCDLAFGVRQFTGHQNSGHNFHATLMVPQGGDTRSRPVFAIRLEPAIADVEFNIQNSNAPLVPGRISEEYPYVNFFADIEGPNNGDLVAPPSEGEAGPGDHQWRLDDVCESGASPFVHELFFDDITADTQRLGEAALAIASFGEEGLLAESRPFETRVYVRLGDERVPAGVAQVSRARLEQRNERLGGAPLELYAIADFMDPSADYLIELNELNNAGGVVRTYHFNYSGTACPNFDNDMAVLNYIRPCLRADGMPQACEIDACQVAAGDIDGVLVPLVHEEANVAPSRRDDIDWIRRIDEDE